MPSQPCLLSKRFGPRRPCLVVNPGGGTAAPRALWLQPSGENNFPLRSAHSSRDKFFSPPGSPLRCDRKRCSPPVPRRPDHNKDAMGANLVPPKGVSSWPTRSEEHTSELQSQSNLVCRLLLEKKKKT